MLYTYSVRTSRECMKNITKEVEDALKKSAAQKGICVVFCPHTTAAITINEDTDPGVQSDFLAGLGKAFPDLPEFLHAEGNSAAHLKSSAVGASETVLIEEGRLILGKWQGIYFCEFDGPRNRQFYVKIIEE